MNWQGPHHVAKTSSRIGVEQSRIASSNSAVSTCRASPIRTRAPLPGAPPPPARRERRAQRRGQGVGGVAGEEQRGERERRYPHSNWVRERADCGRRVSDELDRRDRRDRARGEARSPTPSARRSAPPLENRPVCFVCLARSEICAPSLRRQARSAATLKCHASQLPPAGLVMAIEAAAAVGGRYARGVVCSMALPGCAGNCAAPTGW